MDAKYGCLQSLALVFNIYDPHLFFSWPHQSEVGTLVLPIFARIMLSILEIFLLVLLKRSVIEGYRSGSEVSKTATEVRAQILEGLECHADEFGHGSED